MALLYNELIVCNFCKLNENTWKAISRKANNDLIQVDGIDSFSIDDNYKLERNSSTYSNYINRNIEMTSKL